MNLTTMRANLRRDLKDTEAGAYRWSDEDLDRHIARAVAEYSQACPWLGTVVVAAEAANRYDLSAEAGYLWCEKAEHPLDESPCSLLAVQEVWPGTVALLGGSGMAFRPAGESVRFYYARAHTLDVVSTLPPEHEELVARGAAAFALLAMAHHAVDRLAASGHSAAQWRALAEKEGDAFQADLNRLRQQARGAALAWEGSI